MCLNLLHIAMELRVDENNSVEELLHYSVFGPVVGLRDTVEFDVGILVYGGLRRGCRSSMLGMKKSSLGGRRHW